MVHRLPEFLTILDPQCWSATSRSICSREGWRPPMTVIAAIGASTFSYGLIQPYRIPVGCLFIWSGCWSAVGLMASTQSMTDSMRNLTRLRLRAWTRPRFWFEVARLSCLLGVTSMLSFFCVQFVGTGATSSLLTALLEMTMICQATFFVAATIGYGAMFPARKKVTGRAMECVRFFYQFCIALIAILLWVNSTEESLGDPQTAVMTLAVICIAGTLGLSMLNQSQACGEDSNDC